MSKKKSKANKEKKNKPAPKTTKGRNPIMWQLGLVLAVLSFLLYSNTLSHEFALDDGSAITENWVTKKGAAGIPLLLTKHYRYGYWNSRGVLYRPVSLVMFAIEWGISEDNPFLHHLINVLWYAGTALLLFFTLAKIWSSYHLLLPFAVSLLFLVHPMHVEVVANIKSRDEILAFFFSLLALNFLWDYLKKADVKWLIAGVLSYGIALFSKEGVITFLAIFPLTIYFFHPSAKIKKIVITTALMAIPAVIYLYIRAQILGEVGAGAGKGSPLDNVLYDAPDSMAYMATAFLFLGKYLMTLLLPITLCSDLGFNSVPVTSLADWRVILSLLVHGAMLVYAVMNFQKKTPLVYGILFYGITFSIYSNVIITIGAAYAERFLYVPSLGFAIVVATLLFQVLKVDLKQKTPLNLNGWWKAWSLPLMILAGMALLYGARTIARNPAWKNSYTLYTTDLPNSPNSAKLNYHQALETVKLALNEPNPQEKNRLFDIAKNGFEQAIEIFPSYSDAHGELGLTWFRKGDVNKALASYTEALKHNPGKATVYSNMGIIYFQQNNLAKAEEVYKKALQYDPRFLDAYRNLGSVYAMQKRFDEAIAQYSKGLQYDANNAILHFYLGSVYTEKGETAKGQEFLNKAYQLDPSLRK